jgi:hypothetical protein
MRRRQDRIVNSRDVALALLMGYDSRMPLRNLSHPSQVISWLEEWGGRLDEPAEMILIGSAGILFHAAAIGRDDPLSENSMDVDPITESEAVAELAYEAMIGSEFEKINGWHVNLMPHFALRDLPEGWKVRCEKKTFGNLTVEVPAVADLLAPKLKRNEPRDRAHQDYARSLGLIPS